MLVSFFVVGINWSRVDFLLKFSEHTRFKVKIKSSLEHVKFSADCCKDQIFYSEYHIRVGGIQLVRRGKYWKRQQKHQAQDGVFHGDSFF